MAQHRQLELSFLKASTHLVEGELGTGKVYKFYYWSYTNTTADTLYSTR